MEKLSQQMGSLLGPRGGDSSKQHPPSLLPSSPALAAASSGGGGGSGTQQQQGAGMRMAGGGGQPQLGAGGARSMKWPRWLSPFREDDAARTPTTSNPFLPLPLPAMRGKS